MYPKAASSAPHATPDVGNGQAPVLPELDSLPAVKELLGTMRARLEALNGMDAERIHAK